MKVIVAGFPKTGTKTLYAALKILNYEVYDFLENMTILGEEWYKIIKHGWTTDDFQKMYENVDAVTDYPAYYFWEEIHKAFPDSKIILMIRDEESWCKSMEKELRTSETSFWIYFLHMFSLTARKTVKRLFAFRGPLTLGHNEDFVWHPFRKKAQVNRELLKLKYRAHNAHVIQNAPPDKLLIFDCSEGWKPLCDFLQVPIPKQPFPHKNKTSEMLQETLKFDPVVLKMKREAIGTFTVLIGATGLLGYLLITRGARSLLNSALDGFINTAGHIRAAFN